jgi:hypothetical protein
MVLESKNEPLFERVTEGNIMIKKSSTWRDALFRPRPVARQQAFQVDGMVSYVKPCREVEGSLGVDEKACRGIFPSPADAMGLN